MHTIYNIEDLIEYYMEEATYETRGNLHPVFIETTAYKQADSKNIPILYLLGNKGVGKSSVLNKIAHDNSPDNLYFYFEKFLPVIQERVFQSQIAQKTNATQPYMNYRREWETMIWIQIVRHLYFKHRQSKLFHLLDEGEYLLLFEFLDKNKLPVPLNLTSKIVRFPQRLKTVEIKDVKIELAEEKYTPKASNIYNLESVKDAVAKLLEKKPIYLIVDEIDHVPELNEETMASILGLIEALSSVVRDINLSLEKNHGLLVRVAIRKDMLEAVTRNYVSAQILRREEIDPSWNNEQMEELVARRIREYWRLSPNAVSRQKLLTEILPLKLKNGEKPFEYFSWLSRENPRSLFLFLNLTLQQAVNRKKSYIPNKEIFPLSITTDDLRSVLTEYSRLQLDFQLSGTFLLYPGLDKLVNLLKLKSRALFFNGISRKALAEHLNAILKKEKDLKNLVENWRHRETTLATRIIQVLYDARFIGCKSGTQTIYSPNTMIKDGNLAFHPVYQWSLFNTHPTLVSYDGAERFKKARAQVMQSVDSFLKKDIVSLRNRKIPSKTNQEKRSYRQEDVAFGFIKCVWSVRYLAKTIITSGLEIGFSSTRSQVILTDLDSVLKQLADLMNSDVNDLHLASVLLNSPTTSLCSDKTTFIKEMGSAENNDTYNRCTSGLNAWISPLQVLSLDIETLTKQIDNYRVDQTELENKLKDGNIRDKEFTKQMKEYNRQRDILSKRLKQYEADRERLIEPIEKIFDKLIALCHLLENEENYA